MKRQVLQITRDVTPEPMAPPSDIDTGGLEIQHGAGYEEQDASEASWVVPTVRRRLAPCAAK